MLATLISHGCTFLFGAVWSLILTGIGRLFLGTIALPVFSGEALFLSLGLGLTVTGYLIFLLASFQALGPWPIILLTLALSLLALGGWLRPLPRRPAPVLALSMLDRWAAGGLALLLLMSLLLVLTPEIGKDALIYHLSVPKHYLLRQGFSIIPGNVFAGYPLLAEMHYVLALFYQGDMLAKAMHWTVLIAILAGIGLYVTVPLRGHGYPLLSMLIFLSVPSVFSVAPMAYNDLFVTFFTLSALYAFQRWTEGNSDMRLALCAFFVGSAAGCKYTALLLLPLGCLGILWQSRQENASLRKVLRQCSVFIIVAGLVACPFYVKNWVVLGNPVYPFFYPWFGGLGWDSDQARLYDLFIAQLGMGHSWTDDLLLPWNVSFLAEWDSPRFDGILGPLFLLTLPFLFFIRRRENPIRVLLGYALFAFLFWAFTAQQVRYLIPLLPPLSIVVGFTMKQLSFRRPLFFFCSLILAGSLTFNLLSITETFQRIRPLRAVIGLESREAYLNRLIPTFSMYATVNQCLPPGSRVYLLYMRGFSYLCDRECYVDSLFEAHTLQKILQSHGSPPQIRHRLSQSGFTHLLYNEQILLGPESPLSPVEIARFLAFRSHSLTLLTQQGPYRLERLD